MKEILALICVFAATISDLLIPAIIGKKYPNYNAFKDTISTLGTNQSPVQKIECYTLISVGILFNIYAIIMWAGIGIKSRTLSWYFIGIIIYGIGCILAGFFPEDPRGTEETSSGKIHGIGSGIGFIFLIVTSYFSIKISELESFRSFHIVCFILGLVTFILFICSENKTKGFLSNTGLFQRLNLLVLYLVLDVDCILFILKF